MTDQEGATTNYIAKKRSLEGDLSLPVKRHLEEQGYSVRSEVRGCDLVATKAAEESSELVIVELKLRLNLDVVLQGIERQSKADRVYLAVPRPGRGKREESKRLRQGAELCRRLGLGLMLVRLECEEEEQSKKDDDKPIVEVRVEPSTMSLNPPPKRRKPREKSAIVKEARSRSGDFNTGGQTRLPIVTLYRERSLRLAQALNETEIEIQREKQDGSGDAGTSPETLRERTGIAEAGPILYRNVYRWFKRVGHGRYRLTLAGEEALVVFAAVLMQGAAESPDSVGSA